jgi:hypothetical protein
MTEEGNTAVDAGGVNLESHPLNLWAGVSAALSNLMVVGVGLLILYVVVTVSYSAPFLGAGAYLYLDEEDTTTSFHTTLSRNSLHW